MLNSVRRTGRLLVLEDCNENGSIGQQLAAALAQAGVKAEQVSLLNLKQSFAPRARWPSCGGSWGSTRRRLFMPFPAPNPDPDRLFPFKRKECVLK